jgi:hypothetical protein
MNDSGSFTTHDTARSCEHGFLFYMVQTADLNADGNIDLIVDGKVNSEITWFANDGNGYFTYMQAIEQTLQC